MRRAFPLAVFFELLLVAACGSVSPYMTEPFDARFQKDRDRDPIAQPKETVYDSTWEHVEDRVARPVYRFIDIPAKVRRAKEAYNANSWDEAPDSTWFTNRIGRRRLSTDELLRKIDTGPDMSGPWTVIAAKNVGVSAGFTIRDRLGGIYFIKFDPPGFDALVTGAEIVSSLIMNAAGYNVPFNHLRFVGPKRFVLGKDTKKRGKYNTREKMTEEDLEKILSSLDLSADGTVRLVASKALEGRPVGHFLFHGTRRDDNNDRIPHEHRRELRGAHILAAWINNTDIRVKNTLDMYVGKPGEGYLMHSFLDFGSALGSDGDGHKEKKDGYELHVDYGSMAANLVRLGFHQPYWEENENSGFRSVGLFESTQFDPIRWAPWWGNPAWESMTERDGFWGARIVMSFTDEDIELIVREASYPEPGAEEYLIRVLKERRDKIGAAWFAIVTPLDNFRLGDRNEQGNLVLEFEDLAVIHSLRDAAKRDYRYSIKTDRGVEMASTRIRKTPSRQGKLSVSLAAIEDNHPGHHCVDLEVWDGKMKIGEGISVYLYCWMRGHCIITGLERH